MTKIVILAAGKGKRMNCTDLPKVMIPFLGKPIVEYMVRAAKKSGVDKNPIIVVGFQGQKIKDYLGSGYLYAEQLEQKGTGHAVLCAKETAKDAENILVLYGDQPLTSAKTIKKSVDIHKKNNSVLTLMTATVPNFKGLYESFKGHGRIIRNENGEVQKITETKDATDAEKKITELNPGFFCFNTEWLWSHLPLLKNNNTQGEYYLTDLVETALIEGVKINSTPIPPKECLGVNTPEQLKLAKKLYRS